MNKNFTLLFLAALLLLSISCTKNTVSPTQAQLNARKLESELHVKENTLSTDYDVTIFSINGGIIFSGSGLTITHDGFITIVNGTGSSAITVKFNLDQLFAYEVIPTSSLELYF